MEEQLLHKDAVNRARLFYRDTLAIVCWAIVTVGTSVFLLIDHFEFGQDPVSYTIGTSRDICVILLAICIVAGSVAAIRSLARPGDLRVFDWVVSLFITVYLIAGMCVIAIHFYYLSDRQPDSAFLMALIAIVYIGIMTCVLILCAVFPYLRTRCR